MSPIMSVIEDSFSGLPDDIREECFMAIINKSKQNYQNNQNNQKGNYTTNWDTRIMVNIRKGKQDKKKVKSSQLQSSSAIKKGHTQIDYKSRIRYKKALTWKDYEMKPKVQSKMILVITDFGEMDEVCEW